MIHTTRDYPINSLDAYYTSREPSPSIFGIQIKIGPYWSSNKSASTCSPTKSARIKQKIQLRDAKNATMYTVQSGASSQAKQGGAYFLAVFGSNKDPIAAPGPYETLKPPKLLFVREQIHVNQRDKYDHPHQREPWCLTEVENKVGAAAMPTNFGGSGVLYGPGATIGSLIDP